MLGASDDPSLRRWTAPRLAAAPPVCPRETPGVRQNFAARRIEAQRIDANTHDVALLNEQSRGFSAEAWKMQRVLRVRIEEAPGVGHAGIPS